MRCRCGDDPRMNRTLVLLGVALLVAGLAWPWLSRLPLFRLPGDIVIDRPGFKAFFPVTSMLIVSLAVTAVLWLMRR
jgi:hypothetical protein